MIPLTAPSVLYIDDDEGLRRLARRSLERRGYAVTTAEGAREALGLVKEAAFDLIAVDHYMPELDGLATLALLAEAGIAAPVVYVTGSEESRIAVAALKAGAADYVVKTVGDEFFDLLDSAFRSALDERDVRRQRDEAEAALLASNARLSTLLGEVNHRVANSLQLVSSFLSMQARSATDEASRAALTATQGRVDAIVQVHRRLYASSEVETVEMHGYLQSLLEELQKAWSTPAAPRRLTLEAEPAHLPTDQAVSVGVIVNELVSNACKYAYPADTAGEVRVRLLRQDGRLLVQVEDDGRGFQDGGPSGTGLGGKIITAMAASLKSQVTYDAAHKGVRADLLLDAP